MCSHILSGNNSMTRCSEWLGDPNVRKELGLEKGLSQRTINRAVSLIGEHSDDIIVWLNGMTLPMNIPLTEQE